MGFNSGFKGLKIAMGLKEDCLTLEDGADRLSQNVGKKLPLYAA